jgi:hypothetical protein
MSDRNFLEEHMVIHLSTAAMRDRLQGNWASDVINMQDWRDIIFIIDQCSGVGQGEVSCQSCDDVTPTTTSGISDLRYRYSTTPDTWSAWAAVSTSSGFLTGITPDKTYEVHVKSDALSGTNKYIRLNIDQVTDSPVDIDMIAILFNGRYHEDVNRTTLT